MSSIFRMISRLGLMYSTLWVCKQVREIKIKAKYFFNGLVILVFSIIFWVIGLVMIFVALFFYFSELLKYSNSCFLTGSISMLIGLIISIIGFYFIRSSELFKTQNS